MSHIFISYARKDIEFAKKVVQALADKEVDTWKDWESIPPTTEWAKEIYRGIEEADAFLLFISPDSVRSEWCNAEIVHAIRNRKRIVTILIRDTDPDNIPSDVSKIQWIACRDGQDDFEKAIEAIRITIHTDYEWLKYHTAMQIKALNWERYSDPSRLLREKELREAEEQLSKAGQKDPQPTDLQRRYVLESRRRESRARNRLLGMIVMAAIVLLFLAVFAFSQKNIAIANQNVAQTAQANAEEQAKIARSGELAAAAVANLDTDPERSILLAMQAITVINAEGEALPEAVDALERALHTSRVQLTIPIYADKSIGNPNQTASADNWVNDVAFSPDGKSIAVGRTDGKAQIWDISLSIEAKLLHEFVGHQGWVNSVAFSPDGKLLATASGDDHTARVWNIQTGEIWKTFSEHKDVVYSVLFSPDGTRLATASWDGTAKIWDLAQGQAVFTFQVNKRAMDVAFSPDGNRIAVASDDGTAKIWDANSGAELTTLSGGHAAGINSIVFSQDGKRLATASDDKTVIVWNADSGRPERFITGHAESVRSVTFTSNVYLVTGSIDGTVKMWDLNTGKNLLTFVGHSNSVDAVAYSPVNARLASASRDGTLKIWNAAIGHTSSVNSVVFSPDGKYFATASDDKTAELWDTDSGQELHQFTHQSRVTDVVFSPDGSRLVTASDNMPITIWDPKTGKQLLPEVNPSDSDTVLAFSPDGKLLATAGSAKIIKIWDADTGDLLHELKGHTDRITRISFIKDGDGLISSSLDKTTREWDVISEKQTAIYDNGLMRDASISPNGKWLVTADDDGQVKLWNTSSKLPDDLLDHDNKVYDLAFDTNGTSLATASWDKTAKLWFFGDGEITAGKVQWVFHNTTEVYRVAFSPDGRLLAMAMVDGQVNLYRLNVNELMEYARTRVSRSLTRDECNTYFYQQPCPSKP